MSDPSSRREFLLLSGVAAGAVLLPGTAWSQAPTQTQPAAKKERPAVLAPELVNQFVRAGHGDLEKTKQMLAENPGLLNASWDWGGGDFETAIGGAGHMGRKDIAEFLISQGARIDIFVAAMLGRLDLVKAHLAAYPNLISSLGPHGIPLLTHAQKGGEGAVEVVKYLESLGAK